MQKKNCKGHHIFVPFSVTAKLNLLNAEVDEESTYGGFQGIDYFAEGRNGDGGMPKDFTLDNEDEDAYLYEQSVVEAFIDDDLGVQEQWIEGIFGELPGDRAYEELPQRKTPAQYRAVLLTCMRQRSGIPS